MLLPSLLALSLLAGVGPAGPPVKYKFTSKNVTSADLSAMGQGKQDITMSVTAFLAVTMSDTTGGQIAHVLIDSLQLDAGQMGAMLPDSMLQTKPGTFFHLYIVNGKIKDGLTPSQMSMGAAQTLPGIQMLFPGIKADRPVGASWVDTVAVDSTASVAGTDLHIANKTMTTWTVTSQNGDNIVLDATTTGTTTMNLMGNDVQATTSGKQHLVAAKQGPMREGTSETKAEMSMAMAGSSIPMTTTVTAALTRMP
ncbi:MAG: hypothetical protein ABIZ70_06740 [Gemmatimonadales bacterium]